MTKRNMMLWHNMMVNPRLEQKTRIGEYFTTRFVCYFFLSQIHTTFLPDPTLLPYHKWINERRTLSSLGCASHTPKIIDPRRIVSEQGFRYYHRTATPLSTGRTAQSALSWQMHDQTNIDSPVRRLARLLFFVPNTLFFIS